MAASLNSSAAVRTSLSLRSACYKQYQ